MLVVLHGQGEGVEHDGGEDGVLAGRGGGEGPELVLDRVLGDVTSHRFGVQRKFDAVSLRRFHAIDLEPITETWCGCAVHPITKKL